MRRVNRRQFITASGAGALAAGLSGNIIIPSRAYAAKKTLKILQWVHFVLWQRLLGGSWGASV